MSCIARARHLHTRRWTWCKVVYRRLEKLSGFVSLYASCATVLGFQRLKKLLVFPIIISPLDLTPPNYPLSSVFIHAMAFYSHKWGQICVSFLLFPLNRFLVYTTRSRIFPITIIRSFFGLSRPDFPLFLIHPRRFGHLVIISCFDTSNNHLRNYKLKTPCQCAIFKFPKSWVASSFCQSLHLTFRYDFIGLISDVLNSGSASKFYQKPEDEIINKWEAQRKSLWSQQIICVTKTLNKTIHYVYC